MPARLTPLARVRPSTRDANGLRRIGLSALIVASGLVTLDGTAATIALPAIGRDLGASLGALQWTSNASLLMLAALLVPAGAWGDRFGHRRSLRLGLVAFGLTSLACALATSAAALISWRFAQGAAAALVVPGAIAIIRETATDDVERTRTFGVWAGWSGLIGASGPFVGGGLVDLSSWRSVFLLSAGLTLPALLMLRGVPETPRDTKYDVAHDVGRGKERGAARETGRDTARHDGAWRQTLQLIALLGSVSYGLIEAGRAGWTAPHVLVAFGLGAGLLVRLATRDGLDRLVPPEISTAANWRAASAVTSAVYFAYFGLSFLLVTYAQTVLGYSATWAGLSISPIAILMLLSSRLGGLAARVGSRALIAMGVAIAAAGLVHLALAPGRLSLAWHVMPGVSAFGLGLAVMVAPLTQATMSSLSARAAGTASGIQHAIVRAVGLLAVAALGALATAGSSDVGDERRPLHLAFALCAGILLVAGLPGALSIRDEQPGGLTPASGVQPDLRG